MDSIATERSLFAVRRFVFMIRKFPQFISFIAKVAHLEWRRFGPNERGRNSPLLSGHNEEAKGLFWKNRE